MELMCRLGRGLNNIKVTLIALVVMALWGSLFPMVKIGYNAFGINADSIPDILIICASVCTVVANVISKKSVEGNSPFWITGISQLVGGLILFVAAIIMGAESLNFTIKSTAVFMYICLASIVAYTLWYYILKNNSLSKLFIIKFAEPLFACVFGAVLLGENIFKIQYLLAFVLISGGILLGNRSEEKK